jgi:hypothetical protein
LDSLLRLRHLALADAVHLGAADRANTFGGRLSVLHRHLLWVLDVPRLAAL